MDYDVWGEEDEKTIKFPFFSKSFAAQNDVQPVRTKS